VSEITWIIDRVTGALLVEGMTEEEASALAGDLLPVGHEMGCARPLTMLPPPVVSTDDRVSMARLRVAGYYHNSLVEGPGRRSSLLVVGCSLQCRGCWVSSLHPEDAGTEVPVNILADALLDPAYERDGVSVLGAEPMQQPEGLLALVRALRTRGCPHVLVYSGYTYERLRRMGQQQPVIGAVLDTIQVFVDGPFVQALAERGGPWTGSQNQRVIDLVATRRSGRVVVLNEPSPDPSSERYHQLTAGG
jgi:anaerobic ribonucleoside-triphosphate reductase activating protein